MDKRAFLKSSASALTSCILSRMLHAQGQPAPRTNWAGNLTYSAPNLLELHSIEEIQTAVRRLPHLRALGSRHSFNAIADSTENQISLHALNSISLDPAAKTVTVGAGVRYGDLAPVIDARGFALPNLASLPHISVAGAIATATHGSGLHNGNLATAASAIEFVAANGEIVRLSRAADPEKFAGAAVHLGALGVLTRVTLDVQPTYQVAQTVYLDLPFAQLEHHLEEVFASGYSVSLFTDWQQGRVTQVWIKRRTDRTYSPTLGPDFFGAHPATEKMHPILGHSAEACTEQLGIPGPWYERLPHFKMNFTPSSGQELQTEYFVPLEHGYKAIRAVETLRDQITPHLFVTELRTIDADELWMSMA
jgi:xylitol oxidase